MVEGSSKILRFQKTRFWRPCKAFISIQASVVRKKLLLSWKTLTKHKKNLCMMQSIQSNRTNKSVSTKPETSSFSRVSETMKQTNEVVKDVKGGKKLKLRWKQQQEGKRAGFQKEKRTSVRSLRRIKRRLFLDAVKATPREQHHPGVSGKKKRTGQE